MGAAAHLIHGSSDGRFTITYAVKEISQQEIADAGFQPASYDELTKKYDPKMLKYGYNTVDGEDIYFIPNPALGLWINREKFRGLTMRTFMDKDFLLENEMAETLFRKYAEHQSIYDYHNHLPPREIAERRKYENLTQLWLAEDHYKWRAMRVCGVDERYITGSASEYEKFQKWAEVMPHARRVPAASLDASGIAALFRNLHAADAADRSRHLGGNGGKAEGLRRGFAP